MTLPPIYYHFFRFPLNYAKTLTLQDKIYNIQLARRRLYGDHRDYLLLLEHRPVYTAGRRQKGKRETEYEEARLRGLGADFASTQRGGELTYHGPGQLVGYPLLDLGRTAPAIPIRDYICNIQRTLQTHLLESHGIQHAPSEHTGVFLHDEDEDAVGRGEAKTKIASIGVQVRHRLTTHGFALNVTPSPLPWFAQIVACGLADVKAGCIAGRSKTTPSSEDVTVANQVPGIVKTFGRIFERDMVPMNLGWSEEDGPEDKEEVEEVIREIRDVEADGLVLNRYNPPREVPRDPNETISLLPRVAVRKPERLPNVDTPSY